MKAWGSGDIPRIARTERLLTSTLGAVRSRMRWTPVTLSRMRVTGVNMDQHAGVLQNHLILNLLLSLSLYFGPFCLALLPFK